MTLAILYALASAGFLGAGVVLAQLGLRTVEPLSGAAISVPSFTMLFLLLSPLLLQGEPVIWRGFPVFIAIGLFFPASLTLLTFASNRALGPVITSTLGNLAPLFAVAAAVILLAEPLHPLQLLGLVTAVAGAAVITMTRPRDLGHWRSWALLLPLCSALIRGVAPPVIKLGLAVWPSALWGCLIGYVTSSLVLLTVQRIRNGRFIVDAPRVGLFWFALTGISNGLSALSLFAAVRNGPVTLVAPLAAIYPLVTVALSAMVLKHVAITARIVAGALLTVLGVALVLAG
jgi:drug/metabolite transporter (DMT)-like permease